MQKQQSRKKHVAVAMLIDACGWSRWRMETSEQKRTGHWPISAEPTTWRRPDDSLQISREGDGFPAQSSPLTRPSRRPERIESRKGRRNPCMFPPTGLLASPVFLRPPAHAVQREQEIHRISERVNYAVLAAHRWRRNFDR